MGALNWILPGPLGLDYTTYFLLLLNKAFLNESFLNKSFINKALKRKPFKQKLLNKA